MLFTQFNMDDAMEVRYEEGFEDGALQGKMCMLIQQVGRKLKKGKTVEVIAEELEEEPALIEHICVVMEQCGLDAEPKEIFKSMEEAGALDINE